MKKTRVYISLALFFLIGCNDDKSFDCLKKTGTVNDYQIELITPFNSIHISSNVDVDIIHGVSQSVILTTGENLFPEIEIIVSDGELIFENNNTCNLAREYGVTKLLITTPSLKRIIYEGGGVIQSIGTLSFDTLSIDTKESSGDYQLDIDANELNITTKRISNFYITGSVNDLNIDFLTGDGRFYGKDLIAQNVLFYHNGTNDIMVHPIKKLEGVIDRYGDLIYYNQPKNTPSVVTYSKGKLVAEF
ncbi:MAG: hypothetical protein ACI9GZ_002926 [Bacteroidia bacterium]|jgi:hypothetical protein